MIRKNAFLFIFFLINITYTSFVQAATDLSIPPNLDVKQLNKEQKDKLQNVEYTETLTIPNQYKGNLKFTEGKEEVYLKDARLFFGVGGQYTFSRDLTVDANETPNNATYFNKKNIWNLDNNFNFYASTGLYWRNGIRVEFEYSQMTLETTNFAKDFKKYNTPDGASFIFNQYLQKTGEITEVTNNAGEIQYTTLTNNSLPIAELSVKTYMLNFVFEKVYIKSKIRPYIAVGFGMVSGDISSFVNEGSSMVIGGQFMIGLSYPISKDSLTLYLGYRGLFAQEMEQEFTRITGVSNTNIPIGDNAFDGETYYNPKFVQSKEKYNVGTQNIDLGIRFFF